jgi:hypothetical protein
MYPPFLKIVFSQTFIPFLPALIWACRGNGSTISLTGAWTDARHRG